ncbi:MAG: hypothetical protein V3V22_03515 [Methylococcales bacterium]
MIDHYWYWSYLVLLCQITPALIDFAWHGIPWSFIETNAGLRLSVIDGG